MKTNSFIALFLISSLIVVNHAKADGEAPPLEPQGKERIAASVESRKTQAAVTRRGSLPMRELIATIQNESDKPIRTVFANVTTVYADGSSSVTQNSRIYWAYDNEPGILPGESGAAAKGRGFPYADFNGQSIAKIEITEISSVWKSIAGAGEKPRAVAQAKLKPYRYRVAIRVREHVDGDSYEMTSFSLPLVSENTPATIQLMTGDLTISAKATVTKPKQKATAVVNVSISRNGSTIGSPEIAVALGHNGRIRIGHDDKDHFEVEMVLTRP